MAIAEEALREALDAFDFGGPVRAAQPVGRGHVNDTFQVSAGTAEGGKRFALQRMSPVAFKRPEHVMENIQGVTEYLRERIRAAGGDPEREALRVVPARNGGAYFTDSRSGAWRAFPWIERTICLQSAATAAEFAACGRAFGRFQRLLDGYPARTLRETIPHFHDTEDRLRKLSAAAAADRLGRGRDCREETAFALAREADCSTALNALRAGELPLRVTHNDTKLSNVLLDPDTKEGVCVIDLDTVMPGLAIYDFGDSIRSGANRCEEDERDLDRVGLDMEYFAVYTAAFLEGTGGILTPREIEYLPWGARLMALECGIRFLTDHLEGDVYFHIDRPGQNLDRARTQFKLVADMERKWEQMASVVKDIAKT